jgi:creatinine amidohydrolase
MVPIAALEQHGHHLPLFTDSLLLQEIVRRAHESLAGQTLLAPLMWLGNSHHHLDFPGTLSAPPRVWIDLLGGIVDNFVTHGFRRIVVLNGHGGNDVPGRQALFEVRQRYRDRRDLLLLFATYWDLAEPTARIAGLQQRDMGHACEWETSMILQLAPALVKHHKEVPDVAPGNSFLPAHRAWVTPDRSRLGHVGAPGVATPEKGGQLLQLFAEGVIQFMQRVIRWDGVCWEG